MTPCEALVLNQTLSCAGKIGCPISQCKPDGSFSPRQCHGSTGYCWCVNKDGKEVAESRRAPGKEPVMCEPKQTPCQARVAADALDCGTKLGCDKIECNADGSYVPKQCRGSTGYCWCVDKSGREVEGSKKRGEVNCAEPMVGVMTPSVGGMTPSACECPPVRCAPGYVKKLKLGVEGSCCEEHHECVLAKPKKNRGKKTKAAKAQATNP